MYVQVHDFAPIYLQLKIFPNYIKSSTQAIRIASFRLIFNLGHLFLNLGDLHLLDLGGLQSWFFSFGGLRSPRFRFGGSLVFFLH